MRRARSSRLDSPIVDDTQFWNGRCRRSSHPTTSIITTIRCELNTASRSLRCGVGTLSRQSFIGQGNFDELKRARLLCHAQTERAALIHQTSYMQGALAYQIQVPIVQTCENVNQTSSNNLMITALGHSHK